MRRWCYVEVTFSVSGLASSNAQPTPVPCSGLAAHQSTVSLHNGIFARYNLDQLTRPGCKERSKQPPTLKLSVAQLNRVL